MALPAFFFETIQFSDLYVLVLVVTQGQSIGEADLVVVARQRPLRDGAPALRLCSSQ